MERLRDQLLHRGADLRAAGVDSKARRLVADVGPHTPFRFDEPFSLKILVNLRDGEEVDVKLGGKLANRGQLRPALNLTREDALLKLLLQLHVKGDAAVWV
jgi:hypothetical protein